MNRKKCRIISSRKKSKKKKSPQNKYSLNLSNEKSVKTILSLKFSIWKIGIRARRKKV